MTDYESFYRTEEIFLHVPIFLNVLNFLSILPCSEVYAMGLRLSVCHKSVFY